MRRVFYLAAVLGAGLFLLSKLSGKQKAPLSWETLDHNRPIILQPFAVVCGTIKQVDAAGLSKSDHPSGCMSPRLNQPVSVEWLGRGEREFARYQHVIADFGGHRFQGWTLGIDLTN